MALVKCRGMSGGRNNGFRLAQNTHVFIRPAQTPFLTLTINSLSSFFPVYVKVGWFLIPETPLPVLVKIWWIWVTIGMDIHYHWFLPQRKEKESKRPRFEKLTHLQFVMIVDNVRYNDFLWGASKMGSWACGAHAGPTVWIAISFPLVWFKTFIEEDETRQRAS